MKYYQKLAILLALIWGFIALQRIVITIIMPAIAEDTAYIYAGWFRPCHYRAYLGLLVQLYLLPLVIKSDAVR